MNVHEPPSQLGAAESSNVHAPPGQRGPSPPELASAVGRRTETRNTRNHRSARGAGPRGASRRRHEGRRLVTSTRADVARALLRSNDKREQSRRTKNCFCDGWIASVRASHASGWWSSLRRNVARSMRVRPWRARIDDSTPASAPRSLLTRVAVLEETFALLAGRIARPARERTSAPLHRRREQQQHQRGVRERSSNNHRNFELIRRKYSSLEVRSSVRADRG